MNDVYGMTPINKTAALVTSQSGTEGILTLEQERENLVSHLNCIRSEINSLPKKSKARAKLGLECFETQNQIRAIKAKMKYISEGDLSHYIIDIVKEESTTFQWKRLVEKAQKRLSIHLKGSKE